LAQASGGAYYSLPDAADMLDRIQTASVAEEKRREIRLAQSAPALALFLAVVFAEWSLRRRKQLI
jgi:hypothetical protein